MRSVVAVMLASCAWFSIAGWSADNAPSGVAEQRPVVNHAVRIEYAQGDLLREEMRWHAFVSRYGDPGLANPAVRDYLEDIIPTPGQPPASPAWQPGDQVTFVRRGTDGSHEYTRETTFEHQVNGSWGMSRNDVKRKRCEGPCSHAS